MKNNRKDNPEKEGEVKSNNPFAATTNWAFHYRESRSISLVQLRLLQGSQTKRHPNRMVFCLIGVLGTRKSVQAASNVPFSVGWNDPNFAWAAKRRRFGFPARRSASSLARRRARELSRQANIRPKELGLQTYSNWRKG